MSDPPFEPEVDGDPVLPVGDRLATPGQRLGGALVDGAVLQLVGLLLTDVDLGVAAALTTAAYLVYEVALVAVRGQTLGKMALGTRVVDAGTGSLPTLWQAATRAVLPMAGVVIDVATGTAAVGAFWVLAVYGSLLLDDRRRGLHDKAAGTLVTALPTTVARRRAGVVAVVAAVAVTTVLVASALADLEEERRLGGAGRGRPAVAGARPMAAPWRHPAGAEGDQAVGSGTARFVSVLNR